MLSYIFGGKEESNSELSADESINSSHSEVSPDESMGSSLSESSADESMEEALNSESSDNEASSNEDSKMEDLSSSHDRKRKRETDDDNEREYKREKKEDNVSIETTPKGESEWMMEKPHSDKDAIERYGIPACYYILSRNTIAAENAMQSAINAAEKDHFEDVAIDWMWAKLNEGKDHFAKQEENENELASETLYYFYLIEQYRAALIAEGAMKRKREAGNGDSSSKQPKIG